MRGNGPFTVHVAPVVGGVRLTIAGQRPAGDAVVALPQVTDIFGTAMPVRIAPQASEAADAGGLAIEVALPPLPPGADAPSYLLTLGGHTTWFAPPTRTVMAQAAAPSLVPTPPGSGVVDYTGRDYTAFDAMMRARVAKLVSDDAPWALDHPADPMTTMIEVLAYAGDHLSFRQDAAGTESYPTTARRRLSLQRHARLRDYPVNDGCAARTLLVFTVDRDCLLPAGLAVTTRQPGNVGTLLPPDDPLAAATTVYETIEPLAAVQTLDDLGPLLAGGTARTLPIGAFGVALRGAVAGLVAGRLLVLRQDIAPAPGVAPFGVHVVRLLRVDAMTGATGTAFTILSWHPEDALTRPLVVPAATGGATGAGQVSLFGNVVLADHGRTTPASIAPDLVPTTGTFRPVVSGGDVVLAAPPPAIAAGFDGTQDLVTASLLVPSARASLEIDPRQAVPCVMLDGMRPGMAGVADRWTARIDLLSTPATGRCFAVSQEDGDGAAPGRFDLRFGDDTLGRSPAPGTRFAASIRTADGQSGRVQAGALVQVIGPAPGVVAVTNPLPAAPALPEDTAAIRLFATNAFRTNLRGITPDDWTRRAAGDPLIESICARDTGGQGPGVVGLAVTAPAPLSYPVARARLLDAAILGAPPQIAPVRDVPIAIVLPVYCTAGVDIVAARERLLRQLGSGSLADGSPAYFHPARWPLGRSMVLADLIAAIEGDEAVAFVIADDRLDPRIRFATAAHGGDTAANIAAGVIAIAPEERARVGNRPTDPVAGGVQLLIVAAP